MANYLAQHARRSTSDTTAMIRTLQALRGIFVILIFLVHYPLEGPPTFVPGGDCGVAFFMMLSGFVMTAGYEQRLLTSDIGAGRFAVKRMAKVYPLHLLFFALALMLYDYTFNAKTIFNAVFNLTLLQSWVPSETFTFNQVSWFLSDIFFFYRIFPLIIRHRLLYRRSAVTGFFVAVAVYVSLIWLIPDDAAEYICYILPPVRLIDFIGGMLLWRLYSSLRDGGMCERFSRLSLCARTLTELATIALLIATIFVYSHVAVCYQVAAIWWPAMAAIILVFSVSDRSSGLVGRLLKTKILQAFGAASFVFFLFHRLGMSIVFRVLERLGIELPAMPLLIVNFLAVTICAMIIHRYFQEAWTKRLRR